MNKKLITILGPTACGKTAVATQLAARIGGEIISADSRQVYRRMDIGTGKDLSDYVRNDGTVIPYHLINIAEPGTKYNLFLYLNDFKKAYEDIANRDRTPILCGGTGLYLEAVLKDYHLSEVSQNKELREQLKNKSLEELTQILKELKVRNGSHMHNTTDVDTAQRAIRAIEIEMAVQGDSHNDILKSKEQKDKDFGEVYGLLVDRDLRRQRITKRLHARLEEGMVDEVKSLLGEGIAAEDLMYYGLEYKFATMYVTGMMSYDDMVSKLEIAIHQFAKRQMTWFRGMERRGIHINWIDGPKNEEDIDRIVDSITGR